MEIYAKLQKARDIIKSQTITKEGKNEYSKYDYFTPVQVSQLVYHACKEVGLLTKFDLIRDQFGLTGVLTIYNLNEGGEFIPGELVFKMATDIPQIKATNITQQLGGTMTYTERYLKTTAFEIVENKADFDAQNNGISNGMINKIASLLYSSNIPEAQKKKITNEMDDYDIERAEKCIAYLEINQKNPMENANPSQTDIKNHLNKIK